MREHDYISSDFVRARVQHAIEQMTEMNFGRAIGYLKEIIGALDQAAAEQPDIRISLEQIQASVDRLREAHIYHEQNQP